MISYEKRLEYALSNPDEVYIRKFKDFEKDLIDSMITGWYSCKFTGAFFRHETNGMYFLCETKGKFRGSKYSYRFQYKDPNDKFDVYNRLIEFNISPNWIAVPIKNTKIAKLLYKDSIVFEDSEFIYV